MSFYTTFYRDSFLLSFSSWISNLMCLFFLHFLSSVLPNAHDVWKMYISDTNFLEQKNRRVVTQTSEFNCHRFHCALWRVFYYADFALLSKICIYDMASIWTQFCPGSLEVKESPTGLNSKSEHLSVYYLHIFRWNQNVAIDRAIIYIIQFRVIYGQ